ncbi:hypothetical protein Pyn_09872 [Prunus yedoensis var. nudiflora]|uniref:MATH domain-containing protein n=1 Tax=Prunus yedoensis var. nudiflora TaxID=2094558 RepID=A0A314YV15_PRUYE|nr:hypothetical protein Pyn_09872 [Prunus yedoensis var. nudiflora]
MKNEEEDNLLSSGKFTWRIDHFSKLTNTKHHSDVFFIGGYKWRILIFPKGSKEVEHSAVYLDVAEASSLPSGWSRYADFSFTLVNQLDTNKSTRKGILIQIHVRISGGGLSLIY